MGLLYYGAYVRNETGLLTLRASLSKSYLRELPSALAPVLLELDASISMTDAWWKHAPSSLPLALHPYCRSSFRC